MSLLTYIELSVIPSWKGIEYFFLLNTSTLAKLPASKKSRMIKLLIIIICCLNWWFVANKFSTHCSVCPSEFSLRYFCGVRIRNVLGKEDQYAYPNTPPEFFQVLKINSLWDMKTNFKIINVKGIIIFVFLPSQGFVKAGVIFSYFHLHIFTRVT